MPGSYEVAITTLAGDIVTQQVNVGTAVTLTSGASVQVTEGLAPAQVAPSLVASQTSLTTTSETPLAPFAGVTVTDGNVGATDTVAISVTGQGGTLSGTGVAAVTGGYTITGTASTINALVEAASFAPTAGADGTSGVTHFSLTDTSSFDATTTPAVSIKLTDVDPAGGISATDATNSVATTDEVAASPFTSVTITDPNANQAETATVSLSAANGTLSDSLGGTVSGGVYTVSGSAATVAADLDALVFTPTAHQAAPGSAKSTTITADISDTAKQTTQLSTTVTATAVNDPPVITGTVSGQTTNDTTPVTPFATAAVSDVDTGVEDALVILVTNSSGVATDADGTLSGGGIIKSSPGVYTITAEAPSSLTSALQSLVFTPSREEVTGTSTVTTNFELIAVQQGAGGSIVTTANTATSLTVTQPLVFLGPAGGFGTIEGTSQPALIQAFGYANTIYANGGNDSITTGSGNATVYTDGGSDSITLGGFFNTVGGGDGSHGIYAVSADSGNDTILGGSGNNTVVLGNGNDTVEMGGNGNLLNVGNGTDTIDLTGSNNTVHLGSPSGTDTIILGTTSGGAEQVTGGNGNFSVTVGGTGDTVTLGNGNNLVFATQGMAFITTGAGNATITLGGSGSTVNASGGVNFITGGTGDDTFVLPVAGVGFDFIANFTTGNGDMLDLIPALAATNWNGQASSLANYVQVADSGGNAVISISPTGGGASVGIAVLEGVGNLGLNNLLSHLQT